MAESDAMPGRDVERERDSGHERSGIATDRVLRLAAVLAGIIAAVCIGAMVLLVAFNARSPSASPALRIDTTALPPAPRLDAAPSRTFEDYMRAQNAALDRYRWIDRRSGVVQIPIEHAMRLVARGERAASGTPDAEGPRNPGDRKP